MDTYIFAHLYESDAARVITLALLHPLQETPVQKWTFKQESVVRIGRANDNQVVLYSAVVSRHHVEIRHSGNRWEIINLGTNGTYLDGQRIDHLSVTDGMVIRLARSGPMIQIRLNEDLPDVSTQTVVDVPGSPQNSKNAESSTVPFSAPNVPEAPPSCNDKVLIQSQDSN